MNSVPTTHPQREPGRGFPAFARDERALSSVLGAILVTGILVSTLVTVRVSFVPVWGEEREAAHLRDVERHLRALAGDLDRQAANGTATALSTIVPLGGEGWSLVGEEAFHRLAFEPGAASLRLHAPRLVVMEDNGTATYGLDEQWTTLNGDRIDDVDEVLSLRLRFDEISRGNGGDAVTLRVLEPGGVPAGEFTVYVTGHPSGFNVNVRTRTGDGDVLYDNGPSFHNSERVSPYWVDALDPQYRFHLVARAAQAPLTLELVHTNVGGANQTNDLAAQYAVTYRRTTARSVLVGGGGTEVHDWGMALAAGSLRYESHGRHFVDQTFVLEHGALLLRQSQGAAFKATPGFGAVLAGNVTGLRLALPALRGLGFDATGDGTATLRTSTRQGTNLVAMAPHFEVELTTSQPEAWAALWHAQLGALTDLPAGAYRVETDGDTARLVVVGASTSPSFLDLALTLHVTTIDVHLEM